MPDRDLKLNSLSRFSKQSPRFILEEYSHCEVPAGCGGVVLRWLTPDEPIPMRLDTFSNNGSRESESLDGGGRLWSQRIPVFYGSHVLSFAIEGFDPFFAVILAVMRAKDDYLHLLQPEGDTTVLSLPDGTWKYSLGPLESTDWQKPGFDDSAWYPMIEKPLNMQPDPRWHDGGDYLRRSVQRLTDQGAVGLGIDTSHPEWDDMVSRLRGQKRTIPSISVRKPFTLRKKTTQE